MSTVYIMIGLPYSGKTTYIKSKNDLRNLPSVSSDKFLHEIAKSRGISYNEAFQKYVSDAQSRMRAQMNSLLVAKKDFIFDRTNLTKKSRKQWIGKFKKSGYDVVAITFNRLKNYSQLKSRIESRPEQVISKEVYDSMLRSFERPDESEGFSNIIEAL